MSDPSHEESKRQEVRDQQRPIAEWMSAVMEAKGINATQWAERAKIGRDTVSRAVREDYRHVTSTTTIMKLAKAVGVPPPLSLGKSIPGVPPSQMLAEIMGELLSRLVPEKEWHPEAMDALGKALRHTLLEIAEGERDQDHKMAARIAARAQLAEDNS